MNTYKQSRKKKQTLLLPLLFLGMITCAAVVLGSLYMMYRPFTAEDVLQLTQKTGTFLSAKFTALTETLASVLENPEPSVPVDAEVPQVESARAEDTGAVSPPYIESSNQRGDISALDADGSRTEDQIYLYMLNTGIGPMIYFNQGDSRWSNFLYGGYDPMNKYGCGPTAVAMVINSFSEYPVDPTDVAQWASDNGYYALHGGSYHSLIPDALEAHGLQVESVTDRSVENVSELLSSGHILVALMGRGSLTANGHFVLFTELLDNGNIMIADPADYENCTMEWDLEQLLSELKGSYDSGGPLWAVQPAEQPESSVP